ncbi:MAG: hypothetical protein D6820_10740, partial [Lentisphaerae bacterium]
MFMRLKNNPITSLYPILLLAVIAFCRSEESDSQHHAPGTFSESWELGPIFHWEDSRRRRHLQLFGPLIEYTNLPDGKKIGAFRPLFSREENISRGYVDQDILYPLLSYRLTGQRLVQRGFIGLAWNEDIYDPESSWQEYVLPVYFLGRDSKGQRYGGLFPIYGDLHEIFSYNRIQYLLFPLWMKTIKTSGTTNYHILWPIFHKADGPSVEKRKIFPLIGYAKRKDRWYQAFALWPFIHWGYSLNPAVDGSAFFLFPLFGYSSVENSKSGKGSYSQTFLWPFFTYSSRYTREQTTGIKISAPWPFFIYANEFPAPGANQLWFWPFWGYKEDPGKRHEFILWPLVLRNSRHIPHGMRDQLTIAIIFFRDLVRYDDQTWETFHRIWPLCAWSSKSDGSATFRMLDLIPLRNVRALDRNWVPLYTLYSYQKSPQWGTAHEFLWGTFQLQKNPKGELRKLTLFPFFNWQSLAPEETNLSILCGFYKKQVLPDTTRFSRFLWLFHHQSRNGKTVGHGFFPLYS